MDAGSSHTGIFLYKWTPKELIPSKSGRKIESSAVASMPDKMEQIAKCEVHSGIAKLNVNKIKDYFRRCISTMGEKVSKVLQNPNVQVEIDNTLKLIESKTDEAKESGISNGQNAKVNSSKNDLIPVYLEATAGMRLLNLTSPEGAKNLFSRVKEYLTSIDYFDPKQVRIIPGTLEGYYSWLTVNYLTDTLENNEETYAIIECGGASTQIAHQVDPIKIASAISESKLNEDDNHHVTLYGNEKNIRSTSYLCYGKDQFNLRVLLMLILSKFKEDSTIYSHNRIFVDNPCMNDGLRLSYFKEEFNNEPCLKLSSEESSFQMNSFQDKAEFIFRGTSQPEKCSKLISDIINESTCSKMYHHCVTNHNLLDSNEKIYAISAFYHAAVAVSDRESFQGKVTREQFIQKSTELCHKKWHEIKDQGNRFMKSQCFSNLLVRAMVEDMYHIKDWNKIQFMKKIKGDTIGWTLGSMLSKSRTIEIKYKTVSRMSSSAFYSIATIASIVLIAATIGIIWSLFNNNREKK